MAPGLLVCAPLWCEWQALRRGLDDTVLLRHTGCGPGRSFRAVQHMSSMDFGAMAVAGVAGGIAPWVRSGDVVVASEIRDLNGVVRRCHPAKWMTGELRRHGLSVHCGSQLSTDHVVRGRERSELAHTGALAVDMEAAVLAGLVGERPLISLRVVVDTEGAPLVDAGSVGRIRSALGTLGVLGPALSRWGCAASTSWYARGAVAWR